MLAPPWLERKKWEGVWTAKIVSDSLDAFMISMKFFPEFSLKKPKYETYSLSFPDFPWNFSKSQHFRGFPGFPGSVWTLRDKTIPQLLEKPSCLSEVITENIQNIILVLIFQMIKIYPWLHIHDFELSLDGVSGQRWREKKVILGEANLIP